VNKPLLIFIWAFVITILWIGISSGGGKTVPENCWDKYQTEYEAITNCEKR
jgi:hypothetical protein